MIIDVRSDTFTKPTPAMLQAMYSAQVGDDVFSEDPTVNKLEATIAGIFGMQAGLFCPSGTMTNQIAIKCHTQPGDEILCETLSHVYIYEGGGIAFNSGCQVKPIDGERGRITAEQIEQHINPKFDYKANTSLVAIENTTNRGGGSYYTVEAIKKIKTVCSQHQLAFHLDGARLFNALVASEQKAIDYGTYFDSISICLSKGLGAPVGSVLLGNTSFIAKARRIRKVFGGGMRQAGYLAAAGLYALENNIDRLQQDHDNAKKIAAALALKSFVKNILPVDTNILIFEVAEKYTAASFVTYLENNNVKAIAISVNEVRMVTHLDVTNEMIEILLQIINAS
jgi:threonine aldolase